MIWILFTLLSLIVILFLLPYGTMPDLRGEDSVDFYKAQLIQLEKDIDLGRLDRSEAAQAQIEIERRILRAAGSDKKYQADKNSRYLPGRERLLSLYSGLIILVIGAGFYVLTGSPNLPASPGARVRAIDSELTEGGPTFGEAIEVIEARIRNAGDDKEAYEMLGRTARGIGDFRRAADAYGHLVKMDGGTSRWQVERLASFLALSRGELTPAVKLVVEEFLASFPDHPVADFYMARLLVKEERLIDARLRLAALEKRSDADAPWMSQVNALSSEIDTRLGLIPADQTGKNSGLDVPPEQLAFIQSMVSGLEAKLRQNPEDIDGWLRLIRAKIVLGERRVALKFARDALQSNPRAKPILSGLIDSLQQNDRP